VAKPIEIRLNGRVFESQEAIESFKQDLFGAIKRAVIDGAKVESKKLKTRIKSAILTQTLSHAQLNNRYLKWKIRTGLDKRIGVRTQSFVKSIKFFDDSDERLFIGVRRQNPIRRKGVRRKGQMSIPNYAFFFEFGNKRQPARPTFRPLLRSHAPMFVKTIKNRILASIRDIQNLYGA